jgi:hypothetical protein
VAWQLAQHGYRRPAQSVENGGVLARWHDGQAATPAARAPATTEEETVALGSGVESGDEVGGRDVEAAAQRARTGVGHERGGGAVGRRARR